jgi:hypothetical protein
VVVVFVVLAVFCVFVCVLVFAVVGSVFVFASAGGKSLTLRLPVDPADAA